MESCGLEHRIYKAKQAQKIYEAELTDKRNGFDLTDAELIEIDRLVTPLIKQGQSPYHIIQTFGEKIPCSEATLYRLIESGAIGARNIDLHEKVKRKPRKGRKQTNKDAYARIAVNKQGHLWSDYLKYVSEHDTMTVQLDCVEGAKDDRAVLLTLHWKEVHMQLYFIMDEQTAEQVVLILDKIESALGIELFREMFPLILTDNGHEFTDIEGMEHSCIRPGENRTKVFFCEPNRSDEKGACERNHRLLRNIIPKGTSMDNYNQIQLTEVTNHVNSYKRPSLCGACPYDIAMTSFPRDFFIELGLEKIPPEEVVMSIALLHKNEDVS
jgi:IS30 family transposase